MDDWSELKDLPVSTIIDKYCGSPEELNDMIVLVSARVEQLQSRVGDSSIGGGGESGAEQIRQKLIQLHHSSAESAEQLREIAGERTILMENIGKHINRTEAFFSFLTENVTNLKRYEKERNDVLILKEFITVIENLSSTIKVSVPNSIILYSQAVKLYDSLPKTESGVTESSALSTYMHNSIKQWAAKLSFSIKEEFVKLMTKLGWPNNLNQPPIKNPEKEALLSRRDYLFYQLLGLQCPNPPLSTEPSTDKDSSWSDSVDHITETSASSEQIIPPIAVLLSHFRKRFYYHFYGEKATNCVEKPEWYFTQVIKWMLEVKDYLDTEIQPLLDNAGHEHICAKVTFAKGLLNVVCEKVKLDLPGVTLNDSLLCHYIDEILSFDNDFRNLLNVTPGTFIPVQTLLTEEFVFSKWISTEALSVKEKMDELLSTNSHWKPEIENDNDLKFIPKSADLFLTLLDSISKRYQNLPSRAHRRQFLDMQLELLDEYRTRLIQLKNNQMKSGEPVLSDVLFGIVNSAQYVIQVLGQWSDQVMYVMLALPTTIEDPTSLNESDLDIVSVSPFDYYRECMSLVVDDGEMTVSRAILDQFRAKLPAYTNQRWTTKNNKTDSNSKTQKSAKINKVSSLAVELFLVLTTQLELVNSGLNAKCARKIWQQVAKMVDKTLYLDMILKCNFSSLGCEQFLYDIAHSLVPVFGEFTSTPSNFLPHVTDSVKVLQLSSGSAVLLKQTLQEDTSGTNCALVCQEYKFTTFQRSEEILRILSKRTELVDII